MASMVGHVQRAQAEGLTYRHALTEGQEAERTRIAHELHDETIQSLIAVAQGIELGLNWLEHDPDRAKSMLSAARAQVVESVENLRRMIADLRPPALEELGIVAALQLLASQNLGLHVQVNVSGDARRLEEQQELTLFRVAQEAARNAQRHWKRHAAFRLNWTFMQRMSRLPSPMMGRALHRLPPSMVWLKPKSLDCSE